MAVHSEQETALNPGEKVAPTQLPPGEEPPPARESAGSPSSDQPAAVQESKRRQQRVLQTQSLTLAYDDRRVVQDLSMSLPAGKITVIVGANACGKSTLLRGLARLLKPAAGTVTLDGRDIHSLPTRQVARSLGLLPQTPSAPDGMSVSDLVGRGRYPHQGWFRQWSKADDDAVASALTATDTLALADRNVDELSGGQRQRVWIAMALAQETDILLLDEPTTFLDVAHQVEVLDLITDLNQRTGSTIVIVLHDLNMAARYGDHLIAMRHGRILAQGAPGEVVTAQNVEHIFGLQSRVISDPVSGTPMVVPVGRHHHRPASGIGEQNEGAAQGPGKDPAGSQAGHVESSPVAQARGSRAASRRPAPAVGCFELEVMRVQRLSTNFRRITFTGQCLAGFGVQGNTLDLRIKLVIPVPGQPRLDLTALMEGSLATGDSWYQQWLSIEPAVRGFMRTYSVRAQRTIDGRHELDVDFVLHFDSDGKGGPASQWAVDAAPGDSVNVIGPNLEAATCVTAGSYGGIEWRPGMARHVLLAGDETAVPAIAAILETLPADITGHALLEVPEAADFQELRTGSRVDVQWLARGERPHGELLEAAVRRAVVVPGWTAFAPSGHAGPKLAGVGTAEPEFVDVDQTILWETPQRLDKAIIDASPNPDRPAGALPFYAWIAGEAAVVRGLRRYLVRDVGIDRKQVAFMGYWRQGRSEAT